MSNKIILEEKDFNELYNLLDKIQKGINALIPKISSDWLTGKEVQQILNISSRSLQNYRDAGIIGFSQIGKKVIHYRRADVEELLKNNFNKPFKNLNHGKY